jgi:hypothetical protein
MFRRYRRPKEVAFSFDSFLDLVTNVVGIIIRLILVVWVGARSYTSLTQSQRETKPASAAVAPLLKLTDPLEDELTRQRRELDEARAQLLEQLRHLELTQQAQQTLEHELAALDARKQQLEREAAAIDRTCKDREGGVRAVMLSLEELKRRQQKLVEEIQALQKQPPQKKLLRYRTPVSKPVQTEELLFECYQGRVTYVDVATMLAEIKARLEEKGDVLKHTWQVSDVTRPAGAFRLRYTLERERNTLDAVFATAAPSAHGSFSYGLSEWVAEPVAPIRGEPGDAALARGSQFRLLVDSLDPQTAAVTFWVYPDSFDLYRRLRDYLAERDITVAGRPLPEGVPITCSRRGSRSRGQ